MFALVRQVLGRIELDVQGFNVATLNRLVKLRRSNQTIGALPYIRGHRNVSFNRSITADTAARLGVYFGMEAEFWLNLQAH